jgi:hypothetical protein
MTDSANTLDALLELERAGWSSLCDGTGDKFYGRLMSDNAVMVLANGGVLDRDAVIAALGKSPPWARYELDNVRLIELDSDTAALVYTGTGFRGDGSEPFVGAMSSVYRRSTVGWKLALYQQTPVTG